MKQTNEIHLKWYNLNAVIKDGVFYDAYIILNEERVGLYSGDIIELAKEFNELVEYINKNARWS